MNPAWDDTHPDPFPDTSPRALIRYNSLLSELSKAVDRWAVDSTNLLLNWRSFKSVGMGSGESYPGLKFVGDTSQAIHNSARAQIGKLRQCLDEEALNRDYPETNFKRNIAAIDVLTTVCGRIREISTKLIPTIARRKEVIKTDVPSGAYMPTADELKELRGDIKTLLNLIKVAKPEYITENWKARLKKALATLNGKQSPIDLQGTCDEIASLFDLIAKKIGAHLKEKLDAIPDVPIHINIDGKDIHFRLHNKKIDSVENGDTSSTSCARFLLFSENAARVNVGAIMPNSIKELHRESVGVLALVVENADAIRRLFYSALTSEGFSPEKIHDALDNAGFGLTPHQHAHVLRVLHDNIRCLAKTADIIKYHQGDGKMSPVEAIYRANSLRLPDVSGINTVVEAGLACLHVGEKLRNIKKATDTSWLDEGREIVIDGIISDPVGCRDLIAADIRSLNDDSQLSAELKVLHGFFAKQSTLQKYRNTSGPGHSRK